MEKTKLADRFSDLATYLNVGRVALQENMEHLDNEIDRRAAKSIMTDLAWAIENCTVIGLHQNGEAMEDMMGFDPKED